ncbi:MAG: glycosyltransferase family 4 protein [Thermoplasmata archaeon]
MRILFLALDVDMCGATGDATHVRELVASLSKLGNRLILVGYTPEDCLSNVPNLFKDVDVSVKIPQKRSDTAILRFCSELIKEFKPEVIYERRFSPKVGSALGMLHRLPLVVEVNGLVELELEFLGRPEDARRVSGRFRRILRRRFFANAKRIIAVTEGIKKGLRKLYGIPPERITVIHNGANTDLFKPMDKDSCRKELGLDLKSRYLCFVGNLVAWQGVDDAVRVLPEVRKSIPHMKLLIVGGGAQKGRLQELVQSLKLSKSVLFVGEVPYERVPLYINASDVCVAPLLSSFFSPDFSPTGSNDFSVASKIALKSGYSPLKLYEYMACGRPVVASRVPGFEIVEEGAGSLFNPGDIGDFATKILSVLSDEERMNSMGLKGREIAEMEYSWMAVARRISDILREVVC